MTTTTSSHVPAPKPAPSPDLADTLAELGLTMPSASDSPEEACAALGVDRLVGLSATEASRRRVIVGANRLDSQPGRSAWRRLVDQFRGVLVIVLAAAAVVAGVLGDLKDATVVAIVLIFNGLLGFVQEGRAERAMDALRSMLAIRSRVRRDGVQTEIPTEDLVPGDIVLLEAGDRIPADGRFVEAVALAVDESSLTGESLPVDKTCDAVGSETGSIGDRHNEGFMNTIVVRGRAVLLVTRTGMATEMGRVAALMHEAPQEATPLQRQLDRLGRKLAAVAGGAVAVVFASRLLQGAALPDALLGSVALAVAAIPEGLPAVVTVTLAVGVRQMALRKAIVRRLSSVETLGATTVICSDKTGTLTMNRMSVQMLARADMQAALPASPEHTNGRTNLDPSLVRALEHASLCNDSSLVDGQAVGDPTEVAMLEAAVRVGVDPDQLRSAFPRIGEVPFDSAAKFMATFHRAGNEVLCLVKGAPDVLLGRSTSSLSAGGIAPMTDVDRAAWDRANEELAARGMRVLAVASRRLVPADVLGPDGCVNDPDSFACDLTIELLAGIVDPPRPEARDAIAICQQAGIAVKMITGDHVVTASAIAGELGIHGQAISGTELDAMSDDELARAINRIGVFARVSPEHKVRVVRALKANDHVVAMTGDGVNDAAALRHADIGVAMGITGTAVTKEAADMVLADDNFATIVGAVERGRAIFDNIVKFVRFQLTTNIAAIGTLLGASLLGLPAPLSAIQVLFINIIADGPPAMTLGIDPPDPHTMQRPPRRPGEPILDRTRIGRLIFAAGVMTAGTLTVLAGASQIWNEDVALTMAFTTFVAFQLANVFNARTETDSIMARQTLRNGKLWMAIATVATLQVLIASVGPLKRLFGTVALSSGQWVLCVAVAITVIAAEEARKAVLRRRSSRET